MCINNPGNMNILQVRINAPKNWEPIKAHKLQKRLQKTIKGLSEDDRKKLLNLGFEKKDLVGLAKMVEEMVKPLKNQEEVSSIA